MRISFGTGRKYSNQPTVKVVNGKTESFPSALEARAWAMLVLLEKAGKITDLTRDRKACTFELRVDGKLICRYVADFLFKEGDKRVVADAKGCITPVYRIKKKLMVACHGIEIREL